MEKSGSGQFEDIKVIDSLFGPKNNRLPDDAARLCTRAHVGSGQIIPYVVHLECMQLMHSACLGSMNVPSWSLMSVGMNSHISFSRNMDVFKI